MKRALWWIKQDIRLRDNDVLFYALENFDEVIPVFVFESSILTAPDSSGFHLQAKLDALHELQKNLINLGSKLCVLQGELPEMFQKLREKLQFEAVVSYQETGINLTFERDKQVASWCKSRGVLFQELTRDGVFRRLKSRQGRQKKWQTEMDKWLISTPNQLLMTQSTKKVIQDTLPSIKDFGFEHSSYLQPCNEAYALSLLHDFIHNRSINYHGSLSNVKTAKLGGSRLSLQLAWGTLSLRRVVQSVNQEIQKLKTEPFDNQRHILSLEKFWSRLQWNTHFVQKLESATWMEAQMLNPAFKNVLYENDPKKLTAWLEGKTGFPIIDASMRYFRKTGWLNFRMRAMNASFATCILHLDWRTIRDPMARLMADYVPGIHISQLQMQAGVTGINTFRVYSPQKQLEDHDADGVFVKENVSELQCYTAKQILGHHKTALPEYLKPIVDYSSRRKWMLDQLSTISKTDLAMQMKPKIIKEHGNRHWRRKHNLPFE